MYNETRHVFISILRLEYALMWSKFRIEINMHVNKKTTKHKTIVISKRRHGCKSTHEVSNIQPESYKSARA